MNRRHLEFEDSSGDPSGFSYAVERDRSLCYSYSSDALQNYWNGAVSYTIRSEKTNDDDDCYYDNDEENNSVSYTNQSEKPFDDEDKEVEDKVIADDEITKGERGRTHLLFVWRFRNIFFICMICLVILVASMKISDFKAANRITPCPTAAPTLASSAPSLSPTESPIIHPVCFVCSGGSIGERIGNSTMTKPDEFAFDSSDSFIESEAITANNTNTNIFMDSMNVTANNTDTSIFMDSTNMTCQDLLNYGLDGFIDQNECSYLQRQESIKDRCGCTSIAPPLNTACYICGSQDDTISNPDVVPMLPDFLDYLGETTCSDLDNIGRFQGSISPSECNILQSHTAIHRQCGCSSIAKGDDDEPIQPKPIFRGCPICGSQILGNPLATISISLPWGYVEKAKCNEINAIGIHGYLSPKQCSMVQSQIEVIESCGCYEQEVPDEVPVDEEPPSFPPCYLCGSETTPLGNPYFLLEIPSELGYGNTAYCEKVNRIGISGEIAPEICTKLQSDSSVLQHCGCGLTSENEQQNIFIQNGSPGTPIEKNISYLIESDKSPFPLCFLCGSETDEISNPDSILPLPASLGYPEGTTCEDLNKIGKKGSISPKKCSIIRSETDAVKQCGCENFIVV